MREEGHSHLGGYSSEDTTALSLPVPLLLLFLPNFPLKVTLTIRVIKCHQLQTLTTSFSAWKSV